MRGVIVPPSKLIVKKQRVGFLLGGVIMKGGRLYIYTHKTLLWPQEFARGIWIQFCS